MEGDPPTHGPAPRYPTFCLNSSALTTPGPVILTPALARPAPLAPAPQQWTSTLPKNIELGQGIKEALTYDNMAQAPYPLLTAPSTDNITETSQETKEDTP